MRKKPNIELDEVQAFAYSVVTSSTNRKLCDQRYGRYTKLLDGDGEMGTMRKDAAGQGSVE